jgi:mevalonate kinase
LASTIPPARGLGSSAAVAVALVRAIADAAGSPLRPTDVARLANEAEKLTHGKPSGIDASVVALGMPLRFQAGGHVPVAVAKPVTLLIGDTGDREPTRELVRAVRGRMSDRPTVYDRWLDRIGRLVDEASVSLATGDLIKLGRLLDANHLVLQAMRLSTPALDALVAAARSAGALGAKLSGAGGGGIMVAIAEGDDASIESIAASLADAGARQVLVTQIEPT